MPKKIPFLYFSRLSKSSLLCNTETLIFLRAIVKSLLFDYPENGVDRFLVERRELVFHYPEKLATAFHRFD